VAELEHENRELKERVAELEQDPNTSLSSVADTTHVSLQESRQGGSGSDVEREGSRTSASSAGNYVPFQEASRAETGFSRDGQDAGSSFRKELSSTSSSDIPEPSGAPIPRVPSAIFRMSSAQSFDAGPSRPGGANSPPMTPELHIPAGLRMKQHDIQLNHLVGSGSFGQVWHAKVPATCVPRARQRPSSFRLDDEEEELAGDFPQPGSEGTGQADVATEGDVDVAVKVFMSTEADVSKEIVLMARVSGCPHVLPLLGVVMEQDDPYKDPQVALVTQYMENGSLYDLLVCGPKQHDMVVRGGVRPRPVFGTEDLLRMAWEAARGCEALHRFNVVHRDLACRNLLVCKGYHVYVSDFGFARLRESAQSKGFSGNALGPVRWEAPESLEFKEYSEATDSFSYGVCIYEMFSRSEPWALVTNARVAHLVLGGMRLAPPLNLDPVLGGILLECWEHDRERRPAFANIVNRLERRMAEREREVRETEWERFAITSMLGGHVFLKSVANDRKQRVHERYVRITPDLQYLSWGRLLPTIAGAVAMGAKAAALSASSGTGTTRLGFGLNPYSHSSTRNPNIHPPPPPPPDLLRSKSDSTKNSELRKRAAPHEAETKVAAAAPGTPKRHSLAHMTVRRFGQASQSSRAIGEAKAADEAGEDASPTAPAAEHRKKPEASGKKRVLKNSKSNDFSWFGQQPVTTENEQVRENVVGFRSERLHSRGSLRAMKSHGVRDIPLREVIDVKVIREKRDAAGVRRPGIRVRTLRRVLELYATEEDVADGSAESRVSAWAWGLRSLIQLWHNVQSSESPGSFSHHARAEGSFHSILLDEEEDSHGTIMPVDLRYGFGFMYDREIVSAGLSKHERWRQRWHVLSRLAGGAFLLKYPTSRARQRAPHVRFFRLRQMQNSLLEDAGIIEEDDVAAVGRRSGVFALEWVGNELGPMGVRSTVKRIVLRKNYYIGGPFGDFNKRSDDEVPAANPIFTVLNERRQVLATIAAPNVAARNFWVYGLQMAIAAARTRSFFDDPDDASSPTKDPHPRLLLEDSLDQILRKVDNTFEAFLRKFPYNPPPAPRVEEEHSVDTKPYDSDEDVSFGPVQVDTKKPSRSSFSVSRLLERHEGGSEQQKASVEDGAASGGPTAPSEKALGVGASARAGDTNSLRRGLKLGQDRPGSMQGSLMQSIRRMGHRVISMHGPTDAAMQEYERAAAAKSPSPSCDLVTDFHSSKTSSSPPGDEDSPVRAKADGVPAEGLAEAAAKDLPSAAEAATRGNAKGAHGRSSSMTWLEELEGMLGNGKYRATNSVKRKRNVRPVSMPKRTGGREDGSAATQTTGLQLSFFSALRRRTRSDAEDSVASSVSEDLPDLELGNNDVAVIELQQDEATLSGTSPRDGALHEEDTYEPFPGFVDNPDHVSFEREASATSENLYQAADRLR